MLKLRIKDILEEQNKTVYWLAKQIGMSQNSAGRLVKNETSSINFENLEKIIKALDCNFDDIFEIKD
ncbi:helix-turn-helix domain-containing protein [Clostridium grantii]|uniref:Putative transcriptional regulator n=1 Tax=Clostridium grantii DSM 8605 TaxID=1121316 RepID=A0A1M5SE46_9CLOT|nr:helix-turn-helix transcriptional regulator [Clostridium grantii]SHH36741.1 putative transcriptional regulator [Clostridium grantii DSM 8605]